LTKVTASRIVGETTNQTSSRTNFVLETRMPDPLTAEVAVIGAGSAGATAAIAAGRAGADVLLLEANGFLGGTSTAVLDTFYGFFTPGEQPRKVVGGIGGELVSELAGTSTVIHRPNTYGAGTGITYHPEYLKVAWERLVARAGVRVLLHARLFAAEVHSDEIRSVTVATKRGAQRLHARVFVDASGDADLCHFAGLGYELAGVGGPAQTLTTTFKMVNVDMARRSTVPRAELKRLMREAAAAGEYQLPRLEGSDHRAAVEGMTATIMTRLPSHLTDPELLSTREMQGREQALEYVRFLRDRVPGYERAELASFGSQIGVRETRRVYGDYRLDRSDVLSAAQFDDQIGLCGAPIEDHHDGVDTAWAYIPDGGVVGIPYRTLIPRDARNVLVAGRCFSATHDAHASVRSMAQCMAMGHAAGVAAAAARRHGEVRAVDPAWLRGRLIEQGAIVRGGDAPVVTR
jgi:FAD dependent oxidoreductase